MTQSAQSSGIKFGELLNFTGYLQASSTRPLEDCVLVLRNKQGTHVWFGGYVSEIQFLKSSDPNKEARFVINYYRMSSNSSRATHVAQRLRGVLFHKDGQVHLTAKVSFTQTALLWLWLSIILNFIGIGVLIYSRLDISIGAILLLLTGFPLVGMIARLSLDRYLIRRMVLDSMGV